MARVKKPEPKDRGLAIRTARMRSFFDVPVYRLSKEAYENEFELARRKRLGRSGWAALQKFRQADPQGYAQQREILHDAWGGPWRFNEIVGYIGLYFMGNQVRGHLW